MNKVRHVSEAVVHRLPKYFRQLEELKKRGVERISSGELSIEMGLNASQIRQDFNCFGGFGQQGYGYQVSSLLSEIATILGLDRTYSMVVIGAGNIGRAITRYSGFQKDGYKIVAAFDINPEFIGEAIGDVRVYAYEDLASYLEQNDIQMGIICTQKEAAQNVCDQLVQGGIHAIWNFAPVDVFNDDAFVENVHLSDFLYLLSYRLQNQIEK